MATILLWAGLALLVILAWLCGRAGRGYCFYCGEPCPALDDACEACWNYEPPAPKGRRENDESADPWGHDLGGEG